MEEVADEATSPRDGASTAVHGEQPIAVAEGVQLLGPMDASGFKEPPCLARRSDGQTFQLTDLLYRVLEAIDGQRDLDGIAAAVSASIGKKASADDVGFLIEEKLRPLGLLRLPDGTQPDVEKSNPLLALRLRYVISNEATTARITAPFAKFFLPPVVLVVVLGFFAAVGWLLFAEGVGNGTRQVLYSPGLLVLTFVLAAASAGFHEFGHAAACRYGGGNPGVMGAGIYLVWPAFYTDVTDSYRLTRRARLRTDLGGLFFNMIFALGVLGVWRLTRLDALLVVIPLLLMQMVQQLLPFVRLDGYHILADITGVPDLFSRIKPTLASFKPNQDADEKVTALKPWVRVAITAWVLAVIPLLLGSLLFAVFTLPRVAATAWDSLGLQRQQVSAASGDGDVLGIIAGVLSIVALCLPILSTVYLLGRMAKRAGQGLWSRTEGRPLGQAAVGVGGAALIGFAAFTWWPNGEYRPIQPNERGLLHETVAAVVDVPSGRPSLTAERVDELEGAPFRSDLAEPAAEPDPAGEQPTTSTTVDPSPTEETDESTSTTTEPESTTTEAPVDETTTTVDPTTTEEPTETTTETTSP